MKLKLFLILSFVCSIDAKDLSEILESLNSSKKVKELKSEASLQKSRSALLSTYEAPEIGLGIAHVKESSERGAEFSLGVSQSLSHPFSSSAKSNAINMSNRAIKQKLKHQIHLLNLDVSQKYHSACVSKEIRDSATELYLEQNERLLKIKKAYELGEISKKEFLFYKLDLAKLHQNVSNYKREYQLELSTLQESIDNLKIDELSCNDMQTPLRYIALNQPNKHGEIKELTYKQGVSTAMFNIYDSTFESISYSLDYENELNAKRVAFSISLPLSPLTSKKEKEKAEYFNEMSALNAKKDSLQAEIESSSKSAQLKLETLYDELHMLKSEILPLNIELYKLSKSAQESGEGSMMESIDIARSYKENLLEMLEIKKSYYYEFFELHKKADLELGENYAK